MKKIKSVFKKIVCTIAAGAILLGSHSGGVYAAPTVTASTIDETMKGKITIVKAVDASGTELAANGLLGDYAANVPVEGIGFSFQKVADIENVTDKGVVGTYYTNLDQTFLEAITKKGISIKEDRLVGTKKYYEPQTLQDALDHLNQDQNYVEKLVLTNGKSMGHTDANGTLTKKDLALGLYLIAETDVSNARIADGYLTGDDTYKKMQENGIGKASTDMSLVTAQGTDGDLYASDVDRGRITIASKVVPYFISVPMTNTAVVDGHEPGTVWMYDIVSYPKNSCIDVTKKIIDEDDGDTLRDYEDYEIGQNIQQVIFSGVSPAVSGKKHEKYVITDTMSEGLTFTKITGVSYGKRIKNPDRYSDLKGFTKFDTTDYTISSDEHSFSVTMTASGLKKIDKLKYDALIVVTFDSVLNENAKIGTEGINMDQPGVTWKNEHEAEEKVKGNKVYMFTYEIDISKSGLTDPTKAGFQVFRTSNGVQSKTPVAFVKKASGEYRLFVSGKDDPAKQVKTIRPNEKGKIKVTGVDSDDYTIVEVQTEKGNNLLKSSLLIKITAPEKGNTSLNDPVVTTHRDGTVTAKVSTKNGAKVNSSSLVTKAGKVSVSIENFAGITLHAGGKGYRMFYMIAAVLLMAGGVVCGISKKKEE